jgi:beta-glucosidase
VVLVPVTGRPLAIAWAAEHVRAIALAWLPGERGAQAVADVLFGTCDPGGRLPVTVPRSVGQLPMYYNQKPMRAGASDYVGLKATPLYEFGHGLSYTTFGYSNLRISRRRIRPDETTQISVDVTQGDAQHPYATAQARCRRHDGRWYVTEEGESFGAVSRDLLVD